MKIRFMIVITTSAVISAQSIITPFGVAETKICPYGIHSRSHVETTAVSCAFRIAQQCHLPQKHLNPLLSQVWS